MSNVVLRIDTIAAQGIEGVRRFREEVKQTGITAVDLRETWKVTGAEIAVEQRKQVEQAKATIASYREQIAVAKEVSSSYKRGSEERQLATKMEIDLQRRLQATLGETAAVAGRAGAAASRTAGREERGFLAGSRTLGGRFASFGSTAFLGGAVAGMEAKAALDAVRNFQQSQVQLVQALKNTGEAGAAARKEVTDEVDAMEQLGFKGTDARESLTRLLIATKNAAEASKDEARAADIARARHIDLSAATQILSRVEAGRAAGLSRFGIQTQQVKTYEDQLHNAHIKVTDANRAAVKALQERAKAMDTAATKQKALAEIDKRFSGDAQANARTAAGASERLAASWEKMQVAIGRVLIPQMTAASNAVADYLNHSLKAGNIQRDVKDGAHLLGETFHYVHDAVTDVDKVTGSFTNTLKLLAAWWATGKALAFANTIRKELVAAYDGAAAAAKRFRTTTVAVDAEVAADAEATGAAVDAAFPWMIIAQLAVVAAILIIEHWKTVKSWFGVFWEYMQKTGAAAWAAMKEIAKAAVYVMLEYATAAIRGILEVASHLPFVGDKARAALNSINDYLHTWKPDFGNVISAFQNAGNQAGSSFRDAATAAMSGTTATGGVGAAAGASPNRAGTTGGRTENIVSGGNALQKGLVGTAQSALGNPYLYGGAPSISSPTDCSGLMVAVFQQHGIQLPRTSEQQYAQAPIKDARPLAPGDLVFTEGTHPGHVGLYIGNGQVLEDPHTGDHVKIVSLSGFGWNGESARWWAGKATRTGGTTGPKDAAANVAGDFASAIADAQTAGGTGKKAKGLSEAGYISIQGHIDAVLKTIPKGHLDAIEKAAIAHIKQIQDSLHVGMPAAELAKDRVELAKWGKNLHDEITKNAREAKAAAAAHKKELAKAAAEARQAFTDGWNVDVNTINRGISEQWAAVQQTFDRTTASHVTAMQRAFTGQMQTFDRTTQQHITKMQRDFQKQVAAFDAETQRGLDALQVEQTPQEQAYQEYVAQRAATQTADRLTELKKTLADAQAALAQGGNPLATGGGGVVGNTALLTPNGWVYQSQSGTPTVAGGQDLASLQQAVVDAQKALDSELSDEHESALKDAADTSRKAADAQTKIQQDAYQARRDDQKQALQDDEDVREQQYSDDRDALKQHLQDLEDADEQSYNDRRATQWQALQDSHDDQATMFDADLKLWQTALENKSKTWAQFLRWLQANPISKGINGGDISNPAGFKIPTLDDVAGAIGTQRATAGKAIAQAAGGITGGGGIAWRPTYQRGEQGAEAVIPLTSQHGAAMMRELVRAAVEAGGGGGGGPQTVIYGTFLGATERQVGRSLEGLVTPQQGRVVRYRAPI